MDDRIDSALRAIPLENPVENGGIRDVAFDQVDVTPILLLL